MMEGDVESVKGRRSREYDNGRGEKIIMIGEKGNVTMISSI